MFLFLISFIKLQHKVATLLELNKSIFVIKYMIGFCKGSMARRKMCIIYRDENCTHVTFVHTNI